MSPSLPAVFFLVLLAVYAPIFGSKVLAGGATVWGQVGLYDQGRHPLEDKSNVIVYLKEVNGNRGFTPPNGFPEMASKDMGFSPAVLPVLAGTTVRFTNEDDILHNVFSLSKVKPFDLGLFKKGEERTVTFGKPGLVKVYCNVHERMVGYVLVLANPYFTATDKDGKFILKDVPSGNYQLVAWCRFGDPMQKGVILTHNAKVKVGPASAAGTEVHFDLITAKAVPRHKNKWGKEYKEKY